MYNTCTTHGPSELDSLIAYTFCCLFAFILLYVTLWLNYLSLTQIPSHAYLYVCVCVWMCVCVCVCVCV
jgi:hypothetical protein